MSKRIVVAPKRTQVTLADLFKPGSNRAPENIRIEIVPASMDCPVTATLKKRVGDSARVEFTHPDKGPLRECIPLTATVTKLG
ncbi:MAG: hypothetical protein WCT27_02755 [Patescibacteria group bacterium]|jgi:hypothetical protein